jgi:hypothetical protein
MAFCDRCGTSVGAQSKFCPSCGTPLQSGDSAVLLMADPVTVPAASSPLDDKSYLSATISPEVGAFVIRPPGAEPNPDVRVNGSHQRRSGFRLDQKLLGIAASDGVLALLALLAAGTILAALGGIVFGKSGHHGAVVDWVRTGIALSAATVHGWVSLTATAPVSTDDNGDAVLGHANAAYLLTPLTLTLFTLLAVHGMARRRARHLVVGNGRAALVSAAVTGGVFSIGLGLITVAARGSLGYGLRSDLIDSATSVTVSAFSWTCLISATVLIGLAAFTGRLTVLAHQSGMPGWRVWCAHRIGIWRNAIAHALGMFVTTTSLVTLLIVVVGGYRFTNHILHVQDGGSVTGNIDTRALLALVVAGVLALPTLMIAASGAAQGATLGRDGSSDLLGNIFAGDRAGVGLLAGGVPALAYVGFAVVGLAALISGLRAAMQAAPGIPRMHRWWHVGVAYTGLWVPLWLLARVSFSVHGTVNDLSGLGLQGGSAALGLGLPSLLICAFTWATISVFAGRLLAGSLAATYPGLARRIVGASAEPTWQLLLAEKLRGAGRRVPPALQPASAALDAGQRPHPTALAPLPAGHPVLITAIASAIAISVLSFAPGASSGQCGIPVVAALKAERHVPSTTPPSGLTATWAAEQAAIDSAGVAARAAHKVAAKAEREQQTADTLSGQLDQANADVDTSAAAAATAQDAIAAAQPTVDEDQAALTDAQTYLNEYRDVDTTGYWQQQVTAAQATLATDRAPLLSAQADLAAAQSAQANARNRISSLTTALSAAKALVDRDTPLLTAAQDADGKTETLTNELQSHKAAWQTANDRAIKDAQSYDLVASACRTGSYWRLTPAAVILGAAVAGLSLSRRRRKLHKAR